MRVEARLVRQTEGLSPSGTGSGVSIQLGDGDDDGDLKSKSAKVKAEFRSWARLFSGKFIDRTWIGILMMVFQRTCDYPYFFSVYPPGNSVVPSLRYIQPRHCMGIP